MSRIALALLLGAQGEAPPPDPPRNQETILAVYKDRTSVDPDCRRGAKPGEIVVCARREADRYRVPLITPRKSGDPKGESLSDERHRLQHITTPCEERGPFLVGCGQVGVSVSLGLGKDGGTKFRPLAP